jgi:hypothetical protein
MVQLHGYFFKFDIGVFFEKNLDKIQSSLKIGLQELKGILHVDQYTL